MEKIYTFISVPKEPEKFLRDLEARRNDITSRLNVFFVPWKKEFFGIENELTIHIKYTTGEILVSGPDEDKCKEKIRFIQDTLSEIYSLHLSYEEPELLKVEYRRDAKANIQKIVYPGIMEIIKRNISPNYDIKDISFVFTGERPEKNLSISFKRIGYIRGKEDVPLHIVIAAPSLDICEIIWESLMKKISIKPIEMGVNDDARKR